MRYLYTILFYLLLPIILLRLLWRAVKAPGYASRWGERFGRVPQSAFSKPVVWLHAVSVGETIAAEPLVKRLLARGDLDIVITTMTPTGSHEVTRRFGDAVFHVYAPYDIPAFINRFLSSVKPRLLVVMETELWPNTLHCCAMQNIPVILANGRLSAKSARGYQTFSGLTKPMLANLDKAVMQYQADADRLIHLGMSPQKVITSGSIKFDIGIDDVTKNQAMALKILVEKQQRLVWIAASTHKGEDDILLEVFKALKTSVKNLLLVLVPRHPERFNEVARLAAEKGFTVQRRSQQQGLAAETDVLLGDTMGELMMLYGIGDVVFMGGSFVPVGGHNFIEPAVWGIPTISGPHVFNFAKISELLVNDGGLFIATNAKQMQSQLQNWLKDSRERKAAGQKAREFAKANRGALNKLYREITVFLPK